MHPPGLAVIDLRSESDEIVLTFCGGIHPGTGDPVVRSFIEVASEEVLTKGLSHLLQEVPETSDHRKVSHHRMLALGEVVNRDDSHDEDQKAQDDQRYRHKRTPSRSYRFIARRRIAGLIVRPA